ncbi:hypothetical protein [Epibacterium sp. Ofav1-8]|uniref:hypothetical protein n=1 Tax=Epibacterium sp. Ofav1-8 TaxID=2917735 RepID=UPI001EF68867|nr:hypothetical protein [Epibacterium sp. Ofav1-8]MCG7625559.1 hypothetical protein [Epibacterium sp. Ofav1-8]
MQRRVEPHDSLDDFPTPPWATRALLEFLVQQGFTAGGVAREPAANRGHMVRPLSEFFDRVEASDVHDYGVGYPVQDYLFGPDPDAVDWTITNPPFRLAEAFIARALRTSREGCAVIVRSAFLEGIGRHDRLFSVRPPAFVLQFSERVVMHKGRLSAKGSTATSYCWIVWLHEDQHLSGTTELFWVPPCRARLERSEDYPENTPTEAHEEGLQW